MIVGVTGGMGAGKSCVCGFFVQEGAWVIDADRVGRQSAEDPAVLRALSTAFGGVILDADGNLIRRELGRRAFASAEARDGLNTIVWPPLVRRLREDSRRALDECPDRTVVIDAALFLEWGDHRALCDVLVVVTAPEAIRIQRAMERKGLTEAEVRDRMASQLPESEKVNAADYVIENTGTVAELETRARAVWRQIAES